MGLIMQLPVWEGFFWKLANFLGQLAAISEAFVTSRK
jgi:hypothetical protein